MIGWYDHSREEAHMTGRVSVVVGGQFGSEAKGAVAGFLASEDQNTEQVVGRNTDVPVVCVRVGGPNAGHTVYGRCPTGCTYDSGHTMGPDNKMQHPWRLRQVPVAAVTNPGAELLIAAGSEVDFSVLNREISELARAGYNIVNRLYLDMAATVLSEEHILEEQARSLNARIGSTAKGIGAARVARLWRTANTVADMPETHMWQPVNGSAMLTDVLRGGGHVVIEGTQGYGLGLHTRYYPKATSGDCRAIDFLAASGISPWADYISGLDVWVVARTYPIRVAGASGPLVNETSWVALDLPEERTTVTQKVRRVGDWDPDLVAEAVYANGGPHNANVRLALSMVDYKIPGIAGISDWGMVQDDDALKLAELIADVQFDAGAKVALVGTGPTSIIDLRK